MLLPLLLYLLIAVQVCNLGLNLPNVSSAVPLPTSINLFLADLPIALGNVLLITDRANSKKLSMPKNYLPKNP